MNQQLTQVLELLTQVTLILVEQTQAVLMIQVVVLIQVELMILVVLIQVEHPGRDGEGVQV